MKLFDNRRPCIDPEVVIPWKSRSANTKIVNAPGQFARVYPKTAHEIKALLRLRHNHDKYAPAIGNGVIVSTRALQMIDEG